MLQGITVAMYLGFVFIALDLRPKYGHMHRSNPSSISEIKCERNQRDFVIPIAQTSKIELLDITPTSVFN